LIFAPQLFDLLIEFYGVRFGALRIPEGQNRERCYQQKSGNHPRLCKGSHFHARDSTGEPHRQQAISMTDGSRLPLEVGPNALFLACAGRKKVRQTRHLLRLLAKLPLRRCAHQPLPLSDAATKSKGAGNLPAHASRHLTPFAALGVWHVSVVAPGEKDMRRQRVVLGAQFFQDRLRFSNCFFSAD
jgi:hypothetical protein